MAPASEQTNGTDHLCDGCNAEFSVSHGLHCARGGIIVQRHNEVLSAICTLAAKAMTPSSVGCEPLIDPTASADNNNRGDIIIREFFENGTDCIIDVSVHDLDSSSYANMDSAKALQQKEKQKKQKHSAACAAQRRHFVPFTASIDGLLGSEAQTVLKELATRLSKKWVKPTARCGAM